MNQLVDNAQPLLRSLKAFISGNGLLLLSVYLLLHIGNLSFQMPYSQALIFPIVSPRLKRSQGKRDVRMGRVIAFLSEQVPRLARLQSCRISRAGR